jgi:DnaK suppressor protein
MHTTTHERLLQMRLELQDRIRRIESDLQRRNAPLSADAPDRALEIGNDDVLQGIEAASRSELAQVEAALARLGSGREPNCEACGVPISRERLDAVPYATRCISCEQGTNEVDANGNRQRLK